MERRIYRILIVVSLALGIYLFNIKEGHSVLFLSISLGLIFFLFSGGIHGLIAHSVTPKLKNYTIFYPLVMGLVWFFLLIILVFFILPMFCPHFVFEG
jgi:hypothetical protein